MDVFYKSCSNNKQTLSVLTVLFADLGLTLEVISEIGLKDR